VSILGGESLSQDQIDALFRSLAGGDNNNKTPDPKPESDDEKDSSDDNK